MPQSHAEQSESLYELLGSGTEIGAMRRQGQKKPCFTASRSTPEKERYKASSVLGISSSSIGGLALREIESVLATI